MTDQAEKQDVVREIRRLLVEAKRYKQQIVERVEVANGGVLSKATRAENHADLERIETLVQKIEGLVSELESESEASDWLERAEKVAHEARATAYRWKSVALEKLMTWYRYVKYNYRGGYIIGWEVIRAKSPQLLDAVLPEEKEFAQKLYGDLASWLTDYEELERKRAAAKAEKQARAAIVPPDADADGGVPAPMAAAADADGGAPAPMAADADADGNAPAPMAAAADADGSASAPVPVAADADGGVPTSLPADADGGDAPAPMPADADGGASVKLPAEAETAAKLEKIQALSRAIDNLRRESQDCARLGHTYAIEQSIKVARPMLEEIERLADELKGNARAELLRLHARDLMSGLDGLLQAAERVWEARLGGLPLAEALVQANVPLPHDLQRDGASAPMPLAADADGGAPAPMPADAGADGGAPAPMAVAADADGGAPAPMPLAADADGGAPAPMAVAADADGGAPTPVPADADADGGASAPMAVAADADGGAPAPVPADAVADGGVPAPMPAAETGQPAMALLQAAEANQRSSFAIPTLDEYIVGEVAPTAEFKGLPPKPDWSAYQIGKRPNAYYQGYVEMLGAFAMCGIAQLQQMRAMLIQLEESLARALAAADRTDSFVDARRTIELLGALRQALS